MKILNHTVLTTFVFTLFCGQAALALEAEPIQLADLEPFFESDDQSFGFLLENNPIAYEGKIYYREGADNSGNVPVYRIDESGQIDPTWRAEFHDITSRIPRYFGMTSNGRLVMAELTYTISSTVLPVSVYSMDVHLPTPVPELIYSMQIPGKEDILLTDIHPNNILTYLQVPDGQIPIAYNVDMPSGSIISSFDIPGIGGANLFLKNTDDLNIKVMGSAYGPINIFDDKGNVTIIPLEYDLDGRPQSTVVLPDGNMLISTTCFNPIGAVCVPGVFHLSLADQSLERVISGLPIADSDFLSMIKIGYDNALNTIVVQQSPATVNGEYTTAIYKISAESVLGQKIT